MTIYISGKITGTTDYLNRFKEAEQHLKKAGHEVINPAELNLQFGTNRAWEFYMRNCFHYQTKPEYKGKEGSAKAFADPIEEPNIYCMAPDGSVNRVYPYKAFYVQGFGACHWDQQHEWDSCDAWQRDASILKDKEDQTNG